MPDNIAVDESVTILDESTESIRESLLDQDEAITEEDVEGVEGFYFDVDGTPIDIELDTDAAGNAVLLTGVTRFLAVWADKEITEDDLSEQELMFVSEEQLPMRGNTAHVMASGPDGAAGTILVELEGPEDLDAEGVTGEDAVQEFVDQYT